MLTIESPAPTVIDLRDQTREDDTFLTWGDQKVAETAWQLVQNLNLTTEEQQVAVGIVLRARHVAGVSDMLRPLINLDDSFTLEHMLRVATYVAGHYARKGDLSAEATINSAAAMIHDAGKCALQHIVQAPRKLTPEENQEMESHPAIGVAMARQAGLSGNVVQVLGNHHAYQEHPYGVFQEIVSVPEVDGRTPDTATMSHLVAADDVTDALRAARPYRQTVTSVPDTLGVVGALHVPDRVKDDVAHLIDRPTLVKH